MYDDVKPKLHELIDELFKKVPSGVGCTGFVKITKDESLLPVGKFGQAPPALQAPAPGDSKAGDKS